MAQTADADDADALRGQHMILDDGLKTVMPPQEERAGLRGIERLRQRDGPRPMTRAADPRTTMMAHDGLLRMCAQIVIARHALRTAHATPLIPADADGWPDLELLHTLAQRVILPMASCPGTKG